MKGKIEIVHTFWIAGYQLIKTGSQIAHREKCGFPTEAVVKLAWCFPFSDKCQETLSLRFTNVVRFLTILNCDRLMRLFYNIQNKLKFAFSVNSEIIIWEYSTKGTVEGWR